MNPWRLTVTLMLAAALTSGCAMVSSLMPQTYPLGMSEQEWMALSPDQQLQARERQQLLDEQARARRAEERLREQELEQRQAAELAARRQQAGYGERVQCVISDASGYLGGSWRGAEPVGFDLLVGETARFRLVETGRPSRGVNGEAGFDGQTVQVCRSGGRDCARLVSTSRGFERGARTDIEVNRLVRGSLFCELPQPSRPLRRGFPAGAERTR